MPQTHLYSVGAALMARFIVLLDQSWCTNADCSVAVRLAMRS
jgi:hypothetical protein